MQGAGSEDGPDHDAVSTAGQRLNKPFAGVKYLIPRNVKILDRDHRPDPEIRTPRSGLSSMADLRGELFHLAIGEIQIKGTPSLVRVYRGCPAR
jgi:hypothetical protein